MNKESRYSKAIANEDFENMKKGWDMMIKQEEREDKLVKFI